ncbi:MAG TPA: maleylpyruvate isomerase N-terminal domain-containing protein [Spirochaetia bacterium]|nr:maleylpyruvate isomerase N-terminal domain-containing protein [Spirochaetia bacterium]
MSNAYSQKNSEGLERLRSVIERITDEQIDRPAGGEGWTVGGLLGHMAFYDRRALAILKKWKAQGVGTSAMDIDVANDAMKPLLDALPRRKASELALEAARAIDAEIESLDPELLAKVEANGTPKLDRAGHRAHHLDQIEKAIEQETL